MPLPPSRLRVPARPKTLVMGCLLLLVVGCGARGCGREERPDGAETPPPTLTLAIITDLKGYLEPCGCTSRPLGGIDRLAAQVSACRAQGPTLTLMAGDLFFSGQTHGPHVAPDPAESAAPGREPPPPDAGDALPAPTTAAPGAAPSSGASSPSFAARAQEGQDALSAETVADVLARFEVGAALPGPHDLAQLAALTALAQRAHLPLVGARATSAVRRRVGEHHVLVIGVAEEDPEAAEASTRRLLDLPENASRSLVVVLTRGGRRSARALARVSGVDVVVMGGADVDEPIPPAEVGDALVLHASRQGQGLTLARVYLPAAANEGASPSERPSIVDVSPWSVETRRATLTADVRELEANLVRWEAEGADAAQVSRQRARLVAMQAELDGLAPPPVPSDQRALAATFVELPPDAPREAEVTAAMEALARRVNDHNRIALADWAPEPPAEGEPRFVGSAACASCHAQAFEWWRNHPHGRAYSTLEVRHKQYNLTCVGCHVTGYLQPGGSTVTQLGEDGALRNVGCENCHGPGSAHVASDGTVASARTDVPERICVGCHNPEHSDHFMYDVYRRTLIVPGHGLPPAGGTP